MPLYDSLDDAIYAAAERVREVSGDQREMMSAIYRIGQQYGITEPSGSGETDKVKTTIRYPRGSALAAILHTHPHNTDARDKTMSRFSEDDVNTASRLGVLSAITFGDNMGIRTFAPGIDAVQKEKGDGARRILSSLGREFAHVPEVKVTAKRLGQ